MMRPKDLLNSFRASAVPIQNALLCLALVFFFAACASPNPEPVHQDRHAPLIVARSGDSALLSWETRVGELYTVLYADGRRVGVDWKPLEGASRIPGNGNEIRITDRMPLGITRYYRLMIVPADAAPSRAKRGY